MFNIDYWNSWYSEFRLHQTEAIESVKNEVRGQIILPTGTGKTWIQTAIISNEMKTNIPGIFVISCHRLLLCEQLMFEAVERLSNLNFKFDILFVNSSNTDYIEEELIHRFGEKFNRKNCHVNSTTSSGDVLSFSQSSKSKNRHLLIISTYHSFDVLNKLENINLCVYDEAHETTQDRFSDNIKIIIDKIEKNFFFTATPKIENVNYGMGDYNLYGNVLYEKSPKEMIEIGEIIRPMGIFVHSELGREYSNTEMLTSTIIHSFQKHQQSFTNVSIDKTVGCKLMVCHTGSKELDAIGDSEVYQKFCKDNNILDFEISSNGGYWHNFKTVDKNEFHKLIKNSKNNDKQKMILRHIRILTSGIDIPALTGVLILQDMGTVNLVQTIGRALRLHQQDRLKIYSEELSSKDYMGSFIKPFAHVIIPFNYKRIDNPESLKQLFKTIFNTYNIPIEDFIRTENFGNYEEPLLEKINPEDTKNQKYKNEKLYSLCENIISETYMEKLFARSPAEQLKIAWIT